MRMLIALATLAASLAMPMPCAAQRAAGDRWVVAWTASAHGPYPSGNPSAQPDLSLAFPTPSAGARDQSFRLIVRPSIWGRETRIRLSNAFGTKPMTVDGAYVGLHLGSSAIVAGTNQRLTFGGRPLVTIPPGETIWSDATPLPFATATSAAMLEGRKLAVSFHIVGESGPMTWHAKAMQTSYVSRPDAGAVGDREDETAFPLSTTSWFFLDALDMQAPPNAFAIVAFGDSITDGTLSTLNGDDRWPDVLARRLRARDGALVSVVNAGIGGNRIVGPERYSPSEPAGGGPSALARLERDVLSLSGVAAVIWLEGINDLGRTGTATVEAIEAGLKEGVTRIRSRLPGVRVVGGTLTPALGAANANHGSAEQDEQRRRLNTFIRTSGLFDGVADFEAATIDPAAGTLRREFVHNTTTGGEGDRLHPNRLGYQAMAMAVALDLLRPPRAPGGSAR
jgi:lysophospholipase L1-like esterase